LLIQVEMWISTSKPFGHKTQNTSWSTLRLKTKRETSFPCGEPVWECSC
jgi:hypothetical protein